MNVFAVKSKMNTTATTGSKITNILSENRDMLIIIGIISVVFLIATVIFIALRKKRKEKSLLNPCVEIIVYIIFVLYAMSMMIPFVTLILQSLEDKTIYEINLGKQFTFPDKLIFSNYAFAFNEMEYKGVTFFGMILNSCWYTAICVILPVFMNTLVGYVISKYKFKARNIFYAVIIFSMTIPTLGTTSAIFKLYSDLNLYDTGPLLLIITNLGAGGMNFLVMYAYYKNVPWEYAEAAFVDGAGHLDIFLRIMIPIACPAMVAIGLISGIGAWNEYMNVLMYMPSTPTLASGLYGLSLTLPREGNTPAYYAALVIALIPILVIFGIFSDKIMQNFSVGGIKG